MSEQSDKAKRVDVGHPSGISRSDSGQSAEELEGSEKAFRMKPSWEDRGEVRSLGGEDPLMGPGGNSRPDNPENAGWIDSPQHDVDENRQIPIHKEDPDRLARQRVDQEDEIVAQYDPVTGGEKAVLRPRISKKGAESENL